MFGRKKEGQKQGRKTLGRKEEWHWEGGKKDVRKKGRKMLGRKRIEGRKELGGQEERGKEVRS